MLFALNMKSLNQIRLVARKHREPTKCAVKILLLNVINYNAMWSTYHDVDCDEHDDECVLYSNSIIIIDPCLFSGSSQAYSLTSEYIILPLDKTLTEDKIN